MAKSLHTVFTYQLSKDYIEHAHNTRYDLSLHDYLGTWEYLHASLSTFGYFWVHTGSCKLLALPVNTCGCLWYSALFKYRLRVHLSEKWWDEAKWWQCTSLDWSFQRCSEMPLTIPSLSDALCSISLVQPSPPLPCLLIETSWPLIYDLFYHLCSQPEQNSIQLHCLFTLSLPYC